MEKPLFREGAKVLIGFSHDYPSYENKVGVITYFCGYNIYEVVVDDDISNPIYLYPSQFSIIENSREIVVGDVVGWGYYDRGVVCKKYDSGAFLVKVSSKLSVVKKASDIYRMSAIKR